MVKSIDVPIFVGGHGPNFGLPGLGLAWTPGRSHARLERFFLGPRSYELSFPTT